MTADVAKALQREDHLVHGRRAELEMALHVGLGRGTAVDAGIGVDEGQVPLMGEAAPAPLGKWRRAGVSRQPNQLRPPFSFSSKKF
jgi:hypothetical protein